MFHVKHFCPIEVRNLTRPKTAARPSMWIDRSFGPVPDAWRGRLGGDIADRCRRSCALCRFGKIFTSSLFELGAPRGAMGRRDRPVEFGAACLRRNMQTPEA